MQVVFRDQNISFADAFCVCAEAFEKRASALRDKKNFLGAVEAYKTAVDIDRSLAGNVEFLIARTYFEGREYEKALGVFVSLLQQNPLSTSYQVYSARSLQRLGKQDKAELVLKGIGEQIPFLKQTTNMFVNDLTNKKRKPSWVDQNTDSTYFNYFLPKNLQSIALSTRTTTQYQTAALNALYHQVTIPESVNAILGDAAIGELLKQFKQVYQLAMDIVRGYRRS